MSAYLRFALRDFVALPVGAHLHASVDPLCLWASVIDSVVSPLDDFPAFDDVITAR